MERKHDLRHFKKHSSRRKGLTQTRKVGSVLIYCPYNECPSRLSAGGERNISYFQNVDGHNASANK